MKTRLSVIALIAALACGASGTAIAANENTHPIMFRVSSIDRDGTTIVAPGTAESAVWNRLGRPDRRISDNLWIYHNYRSSHVAAQKHECTTLMITFEKGHVATMVLANSRASTSIVDETGRDPNYLTRKLVAMK